MAQTNYTPIQLYYSTTASAIPVAGNLANGELAINITDGKIYYKNNSGVVTLFGSSSDLTTISFGTTGLTPSTATGGAVTVSGTLATTNGGTNLTSFTSGGAMYATSTSALTTGTLPTTAGGTGLASFTAGDITYYASGTALSKLAIGTLNQVLTSSGTAPQWTTASSISVGTATNLAGGATGSVPYQSSSGTTTFLAAGTNGYVLTLAGGVPTWAASTGISTGKSIAMAMIFGG